VVLANDAGQEVRPKQDSAHQQSPQKPGLSSLARALRGVHQAQSRSNYDTGIMLLMQCVSEVGQTWRKAELFGRDGEMSHIRTRGNASA
jgi:hypothetical protein